MPFNLVNFDKSMLCLDIKPLGPIFGLPGTLMRRQSIQRAVTVNSRKNTSQVVIRNTYSLKENAESPGKSSGNLYRSKSLMSANRIQVLAPKRGDRQRLEQKLSEVWTKDRLPYPGMTGYRGGHLIRTSATSVMRKLSMASTNTTISFPGSPRQRTVTYGSIAESNPFIGGSTWTPASQTDGTSSPSCENAQTYPESFWSTFEYYESRVVSPPTLPIHNKKEEITYVTKIRIGSTSQRSRGGSEASTLLPLPDMKAQKDKPQRNKRLLKTFSTEGIRNWFHH